MFQWWVKYKPYSRTLVLVNQGQWVIKPALIPSRSQKEDKTSKTGHNDTEKLVPEELSKGLVFNMCKGCWKEPSCVRYLLCKCSHGEKKKKKQLYTHTHFFSWCATLHCFSLPPRNSQLSSWRALLMCPKEILRRQQSFGDASPFLACSFAIIQNSHTIIFKKRRQEWLYRFGQQHSSCVLIKYYPR